MIKHLFLAVIVLYSSSVFSKTVDLSSLELPAKFQIEIFASQLPHARQMALGEKGTVFVGTSDKHVYAISNKTVKVIASKLNQPQGVAFYNDDLYIAEIDKISRYPNIEANLNHLPQPIIIANFKLRKDHQGAQVERHAWKTINFGPDGKLYVAIGMSCDSCLPKNKNEGTITRMNPDGSEIEVYAKGVRNSVGFAWHPLNHQLWFTDNGRDNLGDEIPPDKLSHAPVKGLDFGFPYYLGVDKAGRPIPDPRYGKLRSSTGITWEAFNLPAHVAPLNMIFYTGQMFPAEYKNQILLAEHGSWNRSKKVGYRISLVKLMDNKVTSYTPFIHGWQKNEKYWGRPVGLLILSDGSLLISDDETGLIYRVTYRP